MGSATSLQHQKDAWDAYYSGKTVYCMLLTGTSVAFSVENAYASALSPDDSGEAHVALASVPTTSIDTAATPKRVEIHVPDAIFPAVAEAVGEIVRVAYYVGTGDLGTSALIHHCDLSNPITPNGGDVIVRMGADGIVHAEIAAVA